MAMLGTFLIKNEILLPRTKSDLDALRELRRGGRVVKALDC